MRNIGKTIQKQMFLLSIIFTIMGLPLVLVSSQAEAQVKVQTNQAEVTEPPPLAVIKPSSASNPVSNAEPFLFNSATVPTAVKITASMEPPAIYKFILPDLTQAEKVLQKKLLQKIQKKTKGKNEDYPYAFDLNIEGEIHKGIVTRAGQVSAIQSNLYFGTTVKAQPEKTDVVEFVVAIKPDVSTISLIQVKDKIEDSRAGEQKPKWGFPVLLNDSTLTEKNLAAGFLLSWPVLQEERLFAMENLKKNKDTRLLIEYEKKWKDSIEMLLKKGDKDKALQEKVKELWSEGEKIARLIYSAAKTAKIEMQGQAGEGANSAAK